MASREDHRPTDKMKSVKNIKGGHKMSLKIKERMSLMRNITDEASRHLKAETKTYIAYFNSKFEYDLTDHKDVLGNYIENGFIVISNLMNVHENIVIREESIDTPLDLLSYIHPNDLENPFVVPTIIAISEKNASKFEEMIDYLMEDSIYRSPHSHSFYSHEFNPSLEIPDGIVRASAHWNSTDRRDGTRNRADQNTDDQWAIGVYNQRERQFNILFKDTGVEPYVYFKITNESIERMD